MVITGQSYSSSAQIHFPVTMRVSPTCSLISIQQSGSRYVTGSSSTIGYGSKNNVVFWTMAKRMQMMVISQNDF